jgi:hypothetical protein
VDKRLNPNRNAVSTSGRAAPIAVNTWLGWLLPLAQADPLLQQIPATSSAINIVWRSTCGNEIHDVPGKRGASLP